MPLPAIVAPLIAAGTKLVSGAIGSAAQSSANKTNRQIARETNHYQMLMQDRANQFSQQMMREQMKFAEPATQRKMLEDAGFNPYLYASQSAHPSSSPTGSSGNALFTPQVQPVNAMANALSDAASDAANVYNITAQARKANAEAVGQETENEYKVDLIEQSLRLMGLEEYANQIRNDYLNQKESLSVDELQQRVNILGVNFDDLQLAYEINKEWKGKLSEAQFNNIVAATNLLKEEGETQKNLRNYYDKMADAGIMGATAQTILAYVQRNLMPSQIEKNKSETTLNTALGGVASQEYISKGLENDIKKFIGKPKAAAEFLDIVSRRGLNDALTEKTYNESEHIKQVIDWNTYEEILKGLNTATSGAGSALLLKALLGL